MLRLLGLPLAELKSRAEALAARLSTIPGVTARAAEDVAYVGGGSLPDRSMPTWVVEVISPLSDNELSSRLRSGTPAVLPRVHDGKVLLDVRTVFEDQETALVQAVRGAVG